MVVEIKKIEDIDAASDLELKHTPNVEIDGSRVKVTMGLKGIAHPQTEEHLIEWIRAISNGVLVCEVFFTADEVPFAEFEVDSAENLVVQALCNLHGIWQAP